MSRLLLTLIILVVIVVAPLVYLGTRSGERPLTHVEKVVQLGDLKK